MIYQKLKSLRLSHQLSQEQIAEELNVSQSTYARLENGSNSWPKYLKKICSYFQVSPDVLMNNRSIETNVNKSSELLKKVEKQSDHLKTLEKKIYLMENKLNRLLMKNVS